MTQRFDVIVVGTGQAGPSMASRFARSGASVAVIERKKFGGTCVNYGCIPTKALVASARMAWVARNASRWGIDVGGDVSVDMAAVKARMRKISGKSNQGVESWLDGTKGVTLFRGHARFVGERKIEVDGTMLEAERIFINVGGRPRRPDLPGVDEIETWNSTDILESEDLPSHLVVVGGSYIGLEFAQMYRRFGCEVTVVERAARLIGREDDDVSEAVKEAVEADGVKVLTGSECIGFRAGPNGPVLRARCGDDQPEVEASHVLLATGRQPNTDDLGCDAAGIELDGRGFVAVDDELRTSAEGVWALGDVNGRGAFTHTSFNDYEVVADNLLSGGSRKVTDRILCYGLYVDPPLGRVGMTEKQARESGRNVLVGKRPMTQVGRAVEKGETLGFMKALVDADTREVLGATVFGVGGDEVVHAFLPVMYGKLPYDVLARAVAIHPTVSELLPTMLQSLKPLE